MATCQNPLDDADFRGRVNSDDMTGYDIDTDKFDTYLSAGAIGGIWEANPSVGSCINTVTGTVSALSGSVRAPTGNVVGAPCTSDGSTVIDNSKYYRTSTTLTATPSGVDAIADTGIKCQQNYGTTDSSTFPQISCTPVNPGSLRGPSSYTLTGCAECLAGYENTNGEGACEFCSNNQISVAGGPCTQCPQGSVSAEDGFISNGGSSIVADSALPAGPSDASEAVPHITCTGKVCNSTIPPGYRLVDDAGTEFEENRPYLEYVVNGGPPSDTYALQAVTDTFALENGYSATCSPGYRRAGDVRVTPCNEWGGTLNFEGCEPISGSQNYDDEDNSTFDSDFDGSLDAEFKHIAGGVFVAFLGISIMGIIKKKTKE